MAALVIPSADKKHGGRCLHSERAAARRTTSPCARKFNQHAHLTGNNIVVELTWRMPFLRDLCGFMKSLRSSRVSRNPPVHYAVRLC